MKSLVVWLIIAAILVTAFFYVFEGFVDLPVYTKTDSQARCAAYSTCSNCLGDSGCGWASEYADPVSGLNGVTDGTVLACIPKSAGNPMITAKLQALMIKKNGAFTKLNKFVTSLGECTDITCSSMTKCRECALYNKCTWQQVTAGDGSISQKCLDTATAAPADTTHNNIKEVSKCPVPQCSDITDCQECANTTGCAFCETSAKCLKTSEFGTGASQCPKEKQIDVPSRCPCDGITDCVQCSQRVGCGYCNDKKKCVNLSKSGMPPPDTCSTDKIATSPTQCGASSIPQLPPAMDTRNSDKPSAASLAAAADSGVIVSHGWDSSQTQMNNVRPESKQPVSASTNYSVITAPGVARPVGASSIPASVHKPGGDAPLESYVKMLVNSQLAAQGIPTIEPFQVHEAQAIHNASDYMKKVFRGVFA
jgi:hypothetical protein